MSSHRARLPALASLLVGMFAAVTSIVAALAGGGAGPGGPSALERRDLGLDGSSHAERPAGREKKAVERPRAQRRTPRRHREPKSRERRPAAPPVEGPTASPPAAFSEP